MPRLDGCDYVRSALFCYWGAAATAGAEPFPDNFRSVVDEFYDFSYTVTVNATADTDAEQLMRGYDRWFERAKQFPADSVEYLYLHALIYKTLFDMVNYVDEEQAVAYWRQALEFARRAAQKRTRYADVYAMIASLTGQSLNTIGGAGLGYIDISANAVKRALKLDKENALAWETVGFTFLYIPPGYGGSARRSVEAFEKVVRSDQDYIRFWGQIWLSVAYWRNGRTVDARRLISQTLAEAPNNPIVRLFHDNIQNNKDPL